MRSAACLAALVVVGCAAPPPPPPAPAVAPPPAPTVAAEEPPPIGAPVMVSQRLSREAREADLSPSGKLIALKGHGGLHVVEVESGQTRGVLPGCVDQFVFTADGRSIVSTCRGSTNARVWDLATDTTITIALPRPPGSLHVPSQGARVHAPREGAIDRIDAAKGTVTTLETGTRREVTNTEDTPSGYLAATDRDAVNIFGPSGQLVQRIPKANSATAYSLAPSGKRVALADWTGVTLVDAQTGKQATRITPCGEGRVEDVEWAEDEQHLVIACSNGPSKLPARAIVVSADGTEEHELLQAEGGTFTVKPRGERVAVLHNNIGVAVFEVASGAELFRLAPPSASSYRPRLSRDFERALFRTGNHLAGIHVVDRARGAISLRLAAPAVPHAIGSAGDLLYFEVEGRTVYVDPKRGGILRDAAGRLSPDGATFLVAQGADGFDLVDRRTGTRTRVAAPWAIAHEPPRFSDHGALVAILEVVMKGSDRTLRLRTIDARTGKEQKTIPLGPLALPYWWSRDDALIAAQVATPRTREGKACPSPADPACTALQVLDARKGTQLAKIQPKDASFDRVAFLGDGKYLLVGADIYDARSGRLAWSIKGDADARSLGKIGLLLATPAGITLVDPANGKALKDLGPGSISTVSRDGAWMLTRLGRAATLWETATWTRTPTSLTLGDDDLLVLSADGKLAFRVERDDLVVHRFSDGRTLRRALPALDFDVTDEGVFDPTHAASGAALVRRGRDVARSPMGPLSLIENELGHRGLYADFIAGKPVGPILTPAPAAPAPDAAAPTP